MLVSAAKLTKRQLYRIGLLYIVPRAAKLTGRDVVHFLHVGKTGGTAIKGALSGYPLPWRTERRLVIVFHGHGTTLEDIPRDDRFFIFLRDPVARFVSGFNSRKRKGLPRRYVPWSKNERRAFERFATAGELADALQSMDAETARLARKAMQSIEHVASFQADWLGRVPSELEQRAAQLVLLGRQETLEADFEALKSALGLDPTLELPTSERSAHRAPPTAPLTPQQSAAIRNWYARDYDFLEWAEQKLRSGPKTTSQGVEDHDRAAI